MINEEQLIENETPTSFLTAKRMVLVEVLVFSIVMTMLQIAFMRNAYILNLITVLASLGYGVGILAWCRG
jgi:hypothetical protein